MMAMNQTQIIQAIISAQDLSSEMAALLAFGRFGVTTSEAARREAHECSVEALQSIAEAMGFTLSPVEQVEAAA